MTVKKRAKAGRHSDLPPFIPNDDLVIYVMYDGPILDGLTGPLASHFAEIFADVVDEQEEAIR